MKIIMLNEELDCKATIEPNSFVSEIPSAYGKLTEMGFHPTMGEIPVSLTNTMVVWNVKSGSSSEPMSDEEFLAYFLDNVKKCGYSISANRYEFVRDKKGAGVEIRL